MGLLCNAICLSLHPTLDFASSQCSCLAAPFISSPWFRNRGCVGSASSSAPAHPAQSGGPRNVPCGVAQHPREDKEALGQVVLQVPSLEAAMAAGSAAGGCGAPGVAVQD